MTDFGDITDLTNNNYLNLTSIHRIKYSKLQSVEKKSEIYLCIKHNLYQINIIVQHKNNIYANYVLQLARYKFMKAAITTPVHST